MSSQPIKINLGAGYRPSPGYVSIDADPNCKPDIIADLERCKDVKLPLQDSSVDEVRAHHVLEHIGPGFLDLMREIYRICAHGAKIDIAVPHHFHETFINDPTHKRPITVEGLRLFSKAYNRLEIERGGSSSTLGLMLDVDFEIVEFQYIHDPFYDGLLQKLQTQHDPELEEYAQRLFREANNTTLETRVWLMVVKGI